MARRSLLILLAAVVLWPMPAGSYSSHRELDAVASWLAQRPVAVHCLTKAESDADWAIADWGASAYVNIVDGRPADYAVFAHGLCEKLLSIRDGSWKGRHSLSGVGWAVLVITHESYHLRGESWWRDEAKVNCAAVRHVRYTALRLGASDDLSYAIRSWATYWFHGQPASYRLKGCQLPAP